ncbi:MAG: aldehyde ferredoxin oxidoreductase C-terminal domain-containing protein [Desulfobacter sp.]
MNRGNAFGQRLMVDLTNRQWDIRPFGRETHEFLGGRGLNAWYLYRHLPDNADPMSAENILMFSCGLLTGSSAPCSARLHVNSLSPLTHILGSSNIGGYAGAWLRSCGVSSLVIRGRAQLPVYLEVTRTGVVIRDAGSLWGKDALETQEILSDRYKNRRPRILAIGPAGETGVRFASIMTEKDHAAGRTGMGAVMGAKHLKAVVICKGDDKPFPADTPEKKNAVKTYAGMIRKAPEFDFFSEYGGAGYIEWVNDFGIMASKNYSRIGMDDVSPFDGKQLKTHITRSSGCFKCPVQCKADLALESDAPEKVSTRPEFEPLINLGAKCGLTDIKAIIRLDNLCNRLGMDSISAASTMAFAMDLAQNGLLPETYQKDESGNTLDLSWGNAGVMETLLNQMAENKGLGSLLRLGVRAAAQALGPESQSHAVHVKGLELTAYHPESIMGTALGYAVSSRGGDYNNVYASLEYSWTKDEAEAEFGTAEAVDIQSHKAKGFLIKKAVITNILVDSLGLCKVPVLSLLRSFNLVPEIRLINALTGLDLTREDLYASGEKIAALEKLFNLRHGREDLEDRLPDMFFRRGDAGKPIDPSKPGLTRETFDAMRSEFYRAMGWDENGIPSAPDI